MSLYAPYKAVGVVTDGNPFVVNHLGEETFLTTSIGSCFQVYRFDKLTVCLVGRETPGGEAITSLEATGHETFAAVKNNVVVYNRTRIVRTYENLHDANITGMCMVGHTLLTYDNDNKVRVIDTKARKVVSEIETIQGDANITAVAHPATYLNKFLFGYSGGQLELWNVRKQKLVYTFQSHLAYLKDQAERDATDEQDFFSTDNSKTLRNSTPAVTCIEQSPAVDVVGVGFESGDILLINLKLDKVLFSFRQDGGACTSLSFRTDPSAQQFPYMASSSFDGRIHVWNLGVRSDNDSDSSDSSDDEEDSDSDDDVGVNGNGRGSKKNKGPRLDRKLQSSLEEAHNGPISRVHFLHGEPIMVSASLDNSLKVWIFDSPDGGARLLRSREGHSGHPTKIRYYGGTTNASMRDNASAESCELISAGSDNTLRYFNTAIETQNREMSQKPLLKKLGLQRRNERLPHVSDFDASETRQRDWGNLVTIHQNHCNAYVWKHKHRVATEMVLRQPNWQNNHMMYSPDRANHSTAVCITACGNFALVGARNGIIYRYNLQSGLPRGSYPAAATRNSSLKKGTLDQRAMVAGNVQQLQKEVIEAKGWTPLNPKIVSVEEEMLIEPVEVVEVITQHTNEVRGLFVDITNDTVVSCGLDGQLIFWDFEARNVRSSVKLPSPCSFMVGFRDAGFVAVACQDRVVRVYDLQSGKLSRRFEGHSREVSDICFTPDGRRVLTCASDCTVRVWDMPTGRCLSWMKFGSPVLSMAMSLSGEHVCVAQSGKEGIYCYIDRSLYEPVHFWQEPLIPTLVQDSGVMVADTDGGDNDDTDRKDEGDNDTDKEALGDADSDSDLKGKGEGEEIMAPQGQVLTENAREDLIQRGDGSLTLSSLPRGYWATLFNLEAIKARNRPTSAPAPKEQAPFFLPTVHRGGSSSSFPTPKEFASLQQDLKSQQEMQEVFGQEGGTKRYLEDTDVDSGIATKDKSKKAKTGTDTDMNKKRSDEPDQVMQQLAGMGSAWVDDDGGDWGEPVEEDKGGKKGKDVDSSSSSSSSGKGKSSRFMNSGEQVAREFGNKLVSGSDKDNKNDPEFEGELGERTVHQSRLISRKTALPRCKLVAYLLQEFPDTAMGIDSSSTFFTGSASGNSNDGVQHSPTLEYMQTLPPPAVDLELRALCTHVTDEEGLALLHCLLEWETRCIRTGRDFEVLEAYLHRTLLVHGEYIVADPALLRRAHVLQEAHSKSTERLRTLVQSNLCLLKMLANLPPLQ